MERLAGQASLAEEVADIQYGDDPLLALLGDDRQLDLALLDIEDAIGGISLPEDALVRLISRRGSAGADRCQKSRRLEERRGNRLG